METFDQSCMREWSYFVRTAVLSYDDTDMDTRVELAVAAADKFLIEYKARFKVDTDD